VSTNSSFLAAITAAKRAEMALVSAAERSSVRAAGFAKRAGRASHLFREALAKPPRNLCAGTRYWLGRRSESGQAAKNIPVT